jgi:hypothetical protein
MRANKVLFASGFALFAIFFLDGFAQQGAHDVAGRAALGAFELFGAIVALYLLLRGGPGNAVLLDWLACASAILVASVGFTGPSLTLFALYLFVRDPHDLSTKAASAVAAAVVVQAVWAPLIFSKISFILLQIDAGVVGWLVSLAIPGASWSGTVVSTPNGHEVAIYEPCASFHNLSLASLCWVTLTMLHRPYWVKGDVFVGLVAALIQFCFNVWRLVFVCLSLPMYEFWHQGPGAHIFSGVATVCAIIFVQASLVRRDRKHAESRVAASSLPPIPETRNCPRPLPWPLQ